ncbi:protein detoxification 28 [Quercus suber]|uniref:Protein detoxification 28 n=1 Tax=Quercus suber TaxID=58331 RepID=A0AAW0LL21_QUESU
MGQTDAVAEQSGVVAVWLIPMHLSFPFQFTLQRFLQSQVKTWVLAYISGGALALHLRVGIVGAALTLDFSWWVTVLGLFVNVVCGGCADSWTVLVLGKGKFELITNLSFTMILGISIHAKLNPFYT